MIDTGSEFRPRPQISKPNFRGKCSICRREAFLVGGRCLDCSKLEYDPDKVKADVLLDIYKSMCENMAGERDRTYIIGERNYTEIFKLHMWLTNLEIPHSYGCLYDGFQILYPSSITPNLSIIEHFGSYGSYDDRLEIMDYKDGSVKGYLTASEAYAMIAKFTSVQKEGTRNDRF